MARRRHELITNLDGKPTALNNPSVRRRREPLGEPACNQTAMLAVHLYGKPDRSSGPREENLCTPVQRHLVFVRRACCDPSLRPKSFRFPEHKIEKALLLRRRQRTFIIKRVF